MADSRTGLPSLYRYDWRTETRKGKNGITEYRAEVWDMETGKMSCASYWSTSERVIHNWGTVKCFEMNWRRFKCIRNQGRKKSAKEHHKAKQASLF